ncbi:hypothetical protein CcaverHIS002_0700070 [Cutaneotrichosporon cavernicola]|uniref:Ricin B lectin domain-containing protein n=1 Tax=Cutaneotrichosporon cavernicola TaxID=279322 RepID=A0AA48L9K6_9TREE|nr:uncharacterized protein CcaverHIS019_0700070 [Cutaneotrichosporon cavernicola]BEI86661.1 hypothetical protein CcaverHIS002_0700070 [Cutaneotrichosporon cavernicola]BEI94435.1 hypothetical protein CcaverHIS019_0700070 [Cutaneotrichosporon cavernicola]BEJ02212.1 hypothetical protein CcaverHIS631_0700070 [Cutaneotrichosporon cavernicola]
MLAIISALVLYLAVALAAPAPTLEERSSRPIPMYIHPRSAPHMCLTAFRQGQGQYLGARMYIHNCTGAENQQFRTAYGDTVLEFRGTSAQGNKEKYCVVTDAVQPDNPTVDRTNGKPAILYHCPPHKDAKPTGDTSRPVNGVWVQYDHGTIKLKSTNVCLDLKDGNTAQGTPVQQWQCYRGNQNQQWLVNNKITA